MTLSSLSCLNQLAGTAACCCCSNKAFYSLPRVLDNKSPCLHHIETSKCSGPLFFLGCWPSLSPFVNGESPSNHTRFPRRSHFPSTTISHDSATTIAGKSKAWTLDTNSLISEQDSASILRQPPTSSPSKTQRKAWPSSNAPA